MMRIKAELLRVEVIVLILTAVIFVLFYITEPSFATSGNLFLFATFSAELGLVAFGELFVLVSGEVDLCQGEFSRLLAGCMMALLSAWAVHFFWLRYQPSYLHSVSVSFKDIFA